MDILVKPILTEKATDESELRNSYTFIVSKNANKLSDIFCENGHPNEKSHRKFAEYLKEYIDV